MNDSLDLALAELINSGEVIADDLIEQVKGFGSTAIPHLIEIATSEEFNKADSDDPRVFAPLHAIKILGELRAVEAIEPILPMVAWDDDDWLDQVLPEFFGRVGEPAIAPLEKILADNSRTIFTQACASTSLAKIAQEHPGTRKRVVNILTQYLEPEHTQTADHETRAGFIICDLCDLLATEALPAIHRAFEEDRVDTQVTDLDTTEREMQGLPLKFSNEPAEELFKQWHKEPLELVLKCKQCGRERRHKIRVLYVDEGTIERRERGEQTKYPEFIIPQRITCPKCGAKDQYEFTNWSQMTVLSDLVVRDKLEKNTSRDEGRIRYIRFALHDGYQMHPCEALDMYREKIKAKPNDAELRMRYGNVLSFMGYLDEAIMEYQAALKIDPTDIESCVNLGTIYGIQGKFQPAREMLRRAQTLEAGTNVSSDEHTFNQMLIRSRLAPVERNEQLDLELLNKRPSDISEDEQPPVPGATTSKIGRNDPCHCGSGKKFKHCHGK